MLLILLLYCLLLTISLFDTMLLLWLGATVLLNAERRTWGIWLAAYGLLAGAAVFISHSAVLMQSATVVGPELNVWWPLGWAAIVLSPFAWYVAMLWHTGYWEDRRASLYHRHRPLLLATSVLAASLVALLLAAKPLPFAVKTTGFDLSTTPAVFGVPVLVLLYPLFSLSCISFSLDAVMRPGPSARAMGGLARRRARPWLVAASLALLVVSLLTVGILIWLLLYGGRRAVAVVPDRLALDMLWLDLVVSLLVTAAVVLVGQAVVAYEIFTGRTLPRQGLRRQWHNVMVLAAGYGLAVGASLALQLPAAYVVILATIMVALTYALFSWRSYLERERYITHLRPFIASEHVYDALLTSDPAAAATGAPEPFVALCRDVLSAKVGYLFPTGSLSSLVASPLAYPAGAPLSFSLDEALIKRASPQVMTLSLDPAHYGGAIWAVPLWSARGLIGILFLGEKSDGGLYSQEEIEVARSSGERLLDTIAGANLAQRLMALQRQRLIENQVLDQQSRRALHDEILPSLHAAMLGLGTEPAARESTAEPLAQLAEVHRRISALLREMPIGLASQVGRLGLLAALRQMLESEYAHDFDGITWQVEHEAEERARALPVLTGDVIFYAAKEVVRNAARHGRGGDPARPLNLRISAAWRSGLEIRIADDGVGLRATAKATPTSGQGLALHGTMLAVIGGSLATESKPGAGTTVTLFLPQESWNQA